MTRGDKGKLFILFIPLSTLSLLSKIVCSLWLRPRGWHVPRRKMRRFSCLFLCLFPSHKGTFSSVAGALAESLLQAQGQLEHEAELGFPSSLLKYMDRLRVRVKRRLRTADCRRRVKCRLQTTHFFSTVSCYFHYISSDDWQRDYLD